MWSPATGGINLPDSSTPHKHTLCSLLSHPTCRSYKSEQEEGVSCRLIAAHCRSCSLKANPITLSTLTEEFVIFLSEKVKCGFYKSRTHESSCRGQTSNHSGGGEETAAQVSARSWARAVPQGSQGLRATPDQGGKSCLRSPVQSVQINETFEIRMSFSTALEFLDPEASQG